MKYESVSLVPEIQARYEKLRAAGESHNIALMLASRTPCGTRGTDRAFLQGKHLDHGLGGPKDFMTARAIERARRAGISVGGKVYLSQLADSRGPADPAAWVSGLDDVRTACKLKGKGCSSLNIPVPEGPPPVAHRLAPDIVERIVDERLRKDPSLARDIEGLKEDIREKHGRPVDETVFVDGDKPKRKRKPKTLRKV